MTISTNRLKILAAIDRTDKLPTLPAVLQKIHAIANDPRSEAKDLAQIIEKDPAIATRIIKIVNSVLYNTNAGRNLVNVQQAVARMGFKEVERVALGTCLFQTMNKIPGRLFDRENFWCHSICTAFLCVELAKRASARPAKLEIEDFHLAGLIHDIGKILLEQDFGDLLELCVKTALHHNLPLYRVEQKFLGLDHAEIGGILAGHWKLPAPAAEAVRWHHEPMQCQESHRFLVSIVHLANYIANVQDFGTGGDMMGPTFCPEAWEFVGIKPEVIPEIVAIVAANEASLLQIIQ